MSINPNIVAAIAQSGGIPALEPSDVNDRSGLDELKKGRGYATRNGQMLTPEATPEPDDARIEADRRRREEEEKNEATLNKSSPTKALQASVSDEGDDQNAGDNNQGALVQTNNTKQQVKGKSAEKKTTTAKPPRDDEASGNESDGLFVGSSAGSQKSSKTGANKKQGEKREGKSWTDEQEKEIERILGVPPNLHFKILGLKGIVDAAKAPSAYKKLALLIHPDKNGHPDANKAFARLKEAADAYGFTEEVTVGESFLDDEGNPMNVDASDNETGTDSDSASSSDDEGVGGQDGMEIDSETPDLTPKAVELYQEATTHIAHLQKSPKSKDAFQQLDGINDQIKKMNKKWVIDYQGLTGYYQEAKPFIRRVKKNPADDEANQKINEVNQRLDKFIKKHKYPDWKIYPDVVLSGKPEPATPTRAKKAATPTRAKKWKPGLTEKGERIMAMAPTETTNVLGDPVMTRCLFLVEKKGWKNPIAFEDAADVGEKAARGYLEQLPKTERVDIRSKMNSYSPKDRKGFVQIRGVAAKEGDNPKRYPDCAVWVEYEDGSYKFPNRSGCRAIWKTKADRMIEDFFLDNGLEIPWLKKAKRPHQTDVPKTRSTRVSSSKTRETPWRARSPERGRSSRSPDRRRSSSTSSSASYMSDEGLERLEGIEDRMTNFESKFEKMFMMMSEKIDALDGRSSR